MMKPSVYVVFGLLLTSCGYHTLEGSVKPVYFSADSSVFSDKHGSKQELIYSDLKGLTLNSLESVELHPCETVQTLMGQPTVVQRENTDFLVYPGEHILVSSRDDQPYFSTFNHNKIRDNELLVLKNFQKLEKRPEVPRLAQYDFQTILDLEKSIKNKVEPAERASQQLFDSLCREYLVSTEFKELTKDYVHNRYDLCVLSLYEAYKDTLSAHQVYQSKIKALLPKINGLTEISQLSWNLKLYTNFFYSSLFPTSGISNMVHSGRFRECFDTIATNFKGPARDYLLCRLMFQTYEKGFKIPKSYRKKCRRFSMNKDYRRIIARARRKYKSNQGA